MRSLGAQEVVELSGGVPDGRWDVLVDTPGSLDADAVRPALAPGGVLVTTRVASVKTAREVVRSAVGGGPGFAFVATAARSQDLARLLDLVRSGRLRAPVDRVFPLERIAEAHEYAESGEVRGKVVVTVTDGRA